ncbi:aspartyl/asparaginyl beta-hydroxylase domain-containing protein [Nocardia sp. NBC_00565]|uniref:aspartyl/asparaginyl beta-hydroxylase domain-containing protein n=1 Tax=Nocardia sp. NBC_00565 TaxID=2975993 RepID=UPI002E7FDAA1|nr:aspartyl/asparaginyl beta-hydroxylase domain-containing protein [Nocardia sp. NBC_00565]WUC03738.1 aspartyl/asparaginyl beta-hydroxylase domain-containing protein [Nocardia sp. NBC_00565]
MPVDAWSLASTYAETRVHHGYRRVVLVSAGQPQPHAEQFDCVFEALAPVREAWLSWIEPGGFIAPHRDAGPWRERWQVPISATGDWCGADTFTPVDGQAFPVEHWAPHAVINRTDRPRIHLVIDRDVWLDRPPEPFAVYPIPDEMSDLVRRSIQ